MQTTQCIKTRRSIRSYDDKPVDMELIREVIDIATYAPSWKNSQTTRYVAISNVDIKSNIANNCVLWSANNKGIIESAPILMVILTKQKRSGYERDGSFTTSKGTHFESFDAGIATQTLCLALHDKGLSSVIMGIFDEAKVKEVLSIDEEFSVSALVAVGYSSKEAVAPKRKSVDELLTIID